MVRLRRAWRGHPFASLLGIFLLLGAGGAGFVAVSTWQSFAPVSVDFTVPDAPRLRASGPDQTVYRIDATRSTMTYEVTETLAGQEHQATGSTSGIAGDVLVDDADPSRSQVGEVIVDVLQLTSDQSLRDNRIRHDFLQSEQHPLGGFLTTTIDGLPDDFADSTDYHLTLEGDLTAKETTRPATLDATARRDGDELRITASTTILLSDFDIGPIRIPGLVSTGDEAVITLDLVAVDEDAYEEPRTVDASPADYASGGPSFAETVQPILEDSCASCHQPKASGAGEWELATAADAADVAPGLALATSTGYMPPWLASDVGIELQHPMTLSEDAIAAVQAWADAGGPLDVDPETPIEATPEEVDPPRHDLELALPEPYQPTPAKPNDYRCFTLDPGLEVPTVITGYQFLPDKVEVVHHALAYRLSASTADTLARTDEADPGPGWECFGGINVPGIGLSPTGRGDASELVMGWAPGQQPTRYDDGTGQVLGAGDLLVMQIHYHATHETDPDQSIMALEIGEGTPADYLNVKTTTMLAPAEIPCGPGEVGPLCDRDAELGELFRLYGSVGPAIANGLHLLCGTTVEELGQLDSAGLARSSCSHRVGEDARLLAVLGHMHEIGSAFRMTLNPDTPEETVLLDIPRWDFAWQFNYPVAGDVQLRRGDVIRIDCTWDRNLAVQVEPHYVTWAEGTEDEMCFSTISTVPKR